MLVDLNDDEDRLTITDQGGNDASDAVAPSNSDYGNPSGSDTMTIIINADTSKGSYVLHVLSFLVKDVSKYKITLVSPDGSNFTAGEVSIMQSA